MSKYDPCSNCSVNEEINSIYSILIPQNACDGCFYNEYGCTEEELYEELYEYEEDNSPSECEDCDYVLASSEDKNRINMETTNLLINLDDDGTITKWEFSLPTQWLRDHIETDIDTFMSEYNPDNVSEIIELYLAALLDGVAGDAIQIVA